MRSYVIFCGGGPSLDPNAPEDEAELYGIYINPQVPFDLLCLSLDYVFVVWDWGLSLDYVFVVWDWGVPFALLCLSLDYVCVVWDWGVLGAFSPAPTID